MTADYLTIETDVLVIGAGGAGCQAAMAAADAGVRVTLIDKGRLGVSGSTFDPFTRGKGIIAAVEGYNPTDNPEVHLREVIAAARGLADPTLAKIVAYEAPDRFRELLDSGFDFAPNRLKACFGESMVGAFIDQPALARAFRCEIQARDIRLLEKTMAIRLLSDGQRCTGTVAINWNGDVIACQSKAVILATGGASTIFRYNFNARSLTGDGHAMALRGGAELTNLEFYQAILGTTQPARLFFPQWYLAGNPPLYNARGRRFLPDHLPAEFDPDTLVVGRSSHGPFTSSRPSGWVDLAIDAEIQADRGTAAFGDEKQLAGVYCDFASLAPALREELDRRVDRPALDWLKARGIDLEARPAPIAPYAHAFNGGIVIDENGATAVPGLYACGEVAAGPHGANRVGGHMFAVLLVFGKRAGQHAAEQSMDMKQPALDYHTLNREIERVQMLSSRTEGVRPVTVRKAIQRAMSPVMIAKDAARLHTALADLTRIKNSQTNRMVLRTRADLFEALSVPNLLETAMILVQASQIRRESRGPHYRTDYPNERDGKFDKNLFWSWVDQGEHLASWRSLGSPTGD